MNPLLESIGLSKSFPIGSRLSGRRSLLRAVDDVSMRVHQGETLGVVGESGCGKSTLGRLLLRLMEPSAGNIRFEGRDITTLSQRDLRPLRPRMQMVFQDPYGSLNPRRRIGDLIAEPLRIHRDPTGITRSKSVIGERLVELVELVGLKREHLQRYPHEFSGGQRQRIGIARALALDPSLLVADEPVSALDVSVQAQVINLLMDLQARLGLAYVFIAHDLAVVRQIAARTAVMYLGSIVESGPTLALFEAPAHPYTAALLASVPRLSAATGGAAARAVLRGEVPSPIDPPSGCRFHPRCPRMQALCQEERPLPRALDAVRSVACHFPIE